MPILEEEQTSQYILRLLEIINGSEEQKTKLLLIRQLLESIYRKLSADSKTSFNGLFARTQYVHSQLDTPSELVTQINQLRILCNNVAHEEGFQLSEEAYLSSIYTIRSLLIWLSPQLSNPELDDYILKNNAQPFPAFKSVSKQDFPCVVISWSLFKNVDNVTGIEIKASFEEGIDCTLLLNDLETEGKRWSRLAKVLWKYSTLNCYDLKEISGREHCYQSTPTTIIVVEPDFLIDASAVAECFSNQGARPEYFIISRLIREPSSEKPLQGSMVNSILDELIFSPDADYKVLFRKGLAMQPISMVAIGKEAALNIYQTIKATHFPHIKEFADSLQSDSVQLEPTYISPDYGLQGRLDILYKHADKYHIVELKSGSPPQYDVWKQQQMQVVAYNMIIRNCYSRSALGTSSILYSAAPENGLRHVVNTTQMEQDLLMCRNRIVGIMHSLAIDPGVFFGWLMTSDLSADTGFMQSHTQSIITTLKSITDYEYEWFLEQLRLIVREVWLEKTGGLSNDSIYGHNALWQESTQVKSERYRLLGSLTVESLSFNLMRFQLPAKDLITDFRTNDVVVLYRQNTPVSRQEILRGQIIAIDEEHVEVQIRGGIRHIQDGYKDELWALEHDILEASLYNPLSSIFSFLQADSTKRQLFLGLRKPHCDQVETQAQSELEEVVQRMIASRDYHIVQGPPGTGKTSGLLTTYIHSLYNETDKNILILSFTNRAVDEICLNLRKKNISFIRTGRSDEIRNELMENLIQGKKYDNIATVLKSYRIWVATVQSCNAWLNDLLKLFRIDEIIIDEASQIVENSILGIITKAEKTILIGDQNQLPPISRQNDQGFRYTHNELKSLCYDYYNQSLMERLNKVCKNKGWTDACTMLQAHYRMHEEIAGLIQPYYNNSLKSMGQRQKEALPENGESLLSSRLIWIDCPPSLKAFYDPLQVKCILRILDTFVEKGIVKDFGTDIGIVAPFRAMIHALLQCLTEEQKKITIDTVERFQGSERKNIIITLPLHNSNTLKNIEALSADGMIDRKLNVAVSRSQERLIILGCADICRKSGHYRILLDKIAATGKVISYQDIL